MASDGQDFVLLEDKDLADFNADGLRTATADGGYHENTKTPQSLIRDWLSQLLGFSPSLQLKLKHLVEEEPSLDSVSFDDLWEHLITAVSLSTNTGKIYCIADTINEMDFGNDLFVQRLAALGQKHPSKDQSSHDESASPAH